MESPQLTDKQAADQSKKVALISNTPFADHRAMKCRNYSISFSGENTMLTSENGTLFVNPEGGSVIFPEENQTEINRIVFLQDYIASFYPNQSVLIRTISGVFICATEDKFRGYYTFGLNNNLINSNRGAILKDDSQLYFVTAGAEVVHYDLAALIEDLRFKQDTWSIKNIKPATCKFAVDSKDICDDPNGGVYSMTNKGEIRKLPENTHSIVLKQNSQGSPIFFTALGATEDYVCVAGYMKDNKHNAIQLVAGDLSNETDGPVTAPAECTVL